MTESTSHVRGSTLLLVGRFFSIGINLMSQVLIARHLSQTDFGAFALALAIAGVGQVFITLGLHRGATQFFARYDEADDHPRLVGSILLNIGVIVGLGILLFLAVLLARGLLTSSGLLDPTAASLLLILVLLAPIDALDDMLIALFAVVGGSRQIFLRRYLIGPLLRLVVAATLVLGNGDATVLAYGYLLATLFGLVVYGALFIRILSDRGVLHGLRDEATDGTRRRDAPVLAAAPVERWRVAARQHAAVGRPDRGPRPRGGRRVPGHPAGSGAEHDRGQRLLRAVPAGRVAARLAP